MLPPSSNVEGTRTPKNADVQDTVQQSLPQCGRESMEEGVT